MAYIKGMGVTAIWISPAVDNENLNLNNVNPSTPIGAPYHGYSARDFMRVEEHFGDTQYSWTAFDNLAAAAHRYIAMPVGSPGLQGNSALYTAPEYGAVRGSSNSILWVWQLP